MSTAIKIQNFSKTFRDRNTGGLFRAVDDVSFEVPEGKFVTLLGPSGCGKTTILRMIAGFEMPTEGRVFVGGKNVTAVPPERRELPLVFQNYALFPHMNVFENVAYPLRVKRWKREAIRDRVGETLRMMNLEALSKRTPEEMSGGQQQRVALARALVSGPKIVLFDEPLSNLDAKLRAQMRVELKKLQRLAGLTALYVTHDQEEAMALSDLVLVMNHGRLEQVGSPPAVYFRPASRFIADFIGKANFLRAKATPLAGASYDVSLFGKRVRGIEGLPGLSGAVDLMVRPEALHLAAPGVREFEATVTHLSFLGSLTLCELDVQGVKMIAERPSLPPGSAYHIGEKLSFSIQTDRAYLLPPQEVASLGERTAPDASAVVVEPGPVRAARVS